MDTPNTMNPYGVVDLEHLARSIQDAVATLPRTYVPGKTKIRDAVMAHLDCSAMRAEQLVDQLEQVGLVKFQVDRRNDMVVHASWQFPHLTR